MADAAITFHIEGKPYEIDELRLREVAELEDAFQAPLAEIDLKGAKALGYLVWFAKRRKHPDYTLDEALELPVSALEEPSEPRPTKAAKRGNAGSRRSAASTD